MQYHQNESTIPRAYTSISKAHQEYLLFHCLHLGPEPLSSPPGPASMELWAQGCFSCEGVLGVPVTLKYEARQVFSQDGGLLLAVRVVDVELALL